MQTRSAQLLLTMVSLVIVVGAWKLFTLIRPPKYFPGQEYATKAVEFTLGVIAILLVVQFTWLLYRILTDVSEGHRVITTAPEDEAPSQLEVIRRALESQPSYHQLLALQADLAGLGNGPLVTQTRAEVTAALNDLKAIEIRKEVDPIRDVISMEATAREQARQELRSDEGAPTSDIERALARGLPRPSGR